MGGFGHPYLKKARQARSELYELPGQVDLRCPPSYIEMFTYKMLEG